MTDRETPQQAPKAWERPQLFRMDAADAEHMTSTSTDGQGSLMGS